MVDMTSMTSSGQVMKIDGKGCVRTPRSRQNELLDEYERSGLTGPKFSALAGIKYPTFAYWLQRRRKERLSGAQKPLSNSADPVRWLEAVVDQTTSGCAGSGLLVRLPGNATMEVSSNMQLVLAAQLLHLLSTQKTAC